MADVSTVKTCPGRPRCRSCGARCGSRSIEQLGWAHDEAELAALKAAAAVRLAADQAVLDLGVSQQRGRAAAEHSWMMTAHPGADRQPRLVVGGCDDVVMSSSASSGATVVSPAERVEVLFDELAELAGQRNAIDGRIVEIVAELDRDELCGATGARSVAALVAWKMGSSPANADTIATVAHRLAEFPRCAQGMREGRLSLDQVGVIAERAGAGIR